MLRELAGETIPILGVAPKEQPPRKLTGKKTVKVEVKIWREVSHCDERSAKSTEGDGQTTGQSSQVTVTDGATLSTQKTILIQGLS